LEDHLLAVAAIEQRDRADYEAYASDLNLMRSAYDDNDLIQVSHLLDVTRANPHRNIEWSFWNAKLHSASHEINTPIGLGAITMSADGKSILIKDNTTETAGIYSYPALTLLNSLGQIAKNEYVGQLGGRWLTITVKTLKSASIRDSVTGGPLGAFQVPNGRLGQFAGSSHGEAAAVSWVADGSLYASDVTVWNGRTLRPVHHIRIPGRRIDALSVSDDGRVLAVVEVDASKKDIERNYFGSRKIVVRDLSINRVIDEISSGGVSKTLRLSGDGRFLANGLDSSPNFSVRDVRNHRTIMSVSIPVVGGVVFSADSKRILTVGNDLAARLWDIKSGRVLELEKGAMDASIPPDASSVVVAGAGTRIYSNRTNDIDSTLIPNTWATVLGVNQSGVLVVETGHRILSLNPTTWREARAPVPSVVTTAPHSGDANWFMLPRPGGGAKVVSTVDGALLCRISTWTP
jgi:WD40 repeat protein